MKESAALFREQGYEASTLRQIARMTGIKGGSIYHHFESKQEILFLIMDFTLGKLIDQVEAGVRDKDDPLDKLRAAIGIHMQYHVDNLDNTYVADTEIRSLTPDNHGLIMTKRKHYEKIFKDILTEAVQGRKAAIKNVKLTTFAILQMCTGLSLWFRRGGELTIDDVIDQYYQRIVSGIAFDAEKV